MNRENVKRATNELRTKFIDKVPSTAQDFYDLDAALIVSNHNQHYDLEQESENGYPCFVCKRHLPPNLSQQFNSTDETDTSAQMLVCDICCEPFHPICLGLAPDDKKKRFACDSCSPPVQPVSGTAMPQTKTRTRLKKKGKGPAKLISSRARDDISYYDLHYCVRMTCDDQRAEGYYIPCPIHEDHYIQTEEQHEQERLELLRLVKVELKKALNLERPDILLFGGVWELEQLELLHQLDAIRAELLLNQDATMRDNEFLCQAVLKTQEPGEYFGRNPFAGEKVGMGCFDCFGCGESVPMANFMAHSIHCFDKTERETERFVEIPPDSQFYAQKRQQLMQERPDTILEPRVSLGPFVCNHYDWMKKSLCSKPLHSCVLHGEYSSTNRANKRIAMICGCPLTSVSSLFQHPQSTTLRFNTHVSSASFCRELAGQCFHHHDWETMKLTQVALHGLVLKTSLKELDEREYKLLRRVLVKRNLCLPVTSLGQSAQTESITSLQLTLNLLRGNLEPLERTIREQSRSGTDSVSEIEIEENGRS